MSRWVSSVLALGLLSSAAFLGGCETEAFCFANCGDGASGQGGDDGEGGDVPFPTGGSTGQFMIGGNNEGGGGPCSETNGGVELCDLLDNDCNGTVDDLAGIDYSAPKSCGTCGNNCFTVLLNMDPTTVTCAPSSMPGEIPGVCSGECATNYQDLDMDGQSCEYFCIPVQANINVDAICDNKDDDCDNLIDEDVDFCDDEQNCGKCGGICVVGNGTPECVQTDMAPTCTELNAHCEIAACNPGWVDLDGSYATGCEYNCTITGPEVCGDQVDNDCDGLVDQADDLSGDPAINIVCVGDLDGICALPVHQGFTECLNGVVTCTGPNVLFEDDVLEMCNSLDDDCDGQADDTPSDAGGACGVSNNFPCTFGTLACQAGALNCVGAINPGVESCNGQDDNCDGQIDLTGGVVPADAQGPCNVPPPPPLGATSPCVGGTRACVGGTVQCLGDVGPTSSNDSCGVDANCDGLLTGQPNLMTSVTNCGSCGNNCNTGAVNAAFSCVSGGCVFQNCLPGFVDLDGNGTCEYACTFVSAQEACNNQDDNCNGQVDEGVVAPSPKQVCGVSPAASRAECTTSVGVACVAGNWQCTFPAGVCSPSCAAASEICDGLDNDCDGFFNENVPDFNQPCASDDGLPISQGECRTTGNKVCNGPGATVCNAVAASCASLPGGCTEACDGKDNDCDGSIDEPFTAKGTNATFFYRPKVIKVGAGNLWTYQYEASRPNATASTPGTGNGYWTSGPPATTFDETPSCSETNKVPWFNVTPAEVQQTCSAMGGTICSNTQWKDACRTVPLAGNDCVWGYGSDAAACTSAFTATKRCNLGPSFDFNTSLAGDQDGLLPTASSLLSSCWAPWENLSTNPVGVNGRLFDITGNLREITRTNATTFTIMGGAFNSGADAGATCTFDFYKVDDEFQFYDTGFRCCFTSNPTL